MSEYSDLNYDMNTMIDVPETFKIGKFEIKDVVKLKSKEPLYNCFVQSSNKVFGSIMAKINNPQKYLNFLNILGLKDEININGIFKEKPMNIKSLSKPQAITLSYGYGILYSPLRFLYMMANGVTGQKKPIKLVKNIKDLLGNSIFTSNNSSENMINPAILEKFYKTLDILGQRFQPLYKYNSSSKTGTTKVLVNGQYQDKAINCTLMTFYPIKKPRFIIFFCVENPKNGPRHVSHFYTRMNMPMIFNSIGSYLDEYIKENK
jgi:cell division protein FtsI (penicillin-binding protein 3)